MKINMTSKDGVTLLTAGKYCTENIEVTPTFSPALQSKTTTPNKGTQIVKPDTGYDGLSQVTVNPIPDNYIEPSGTMEITVNGTYDVTDKASAIVRVPIPDGYILPTGEMSITENGIYDVTEKATANVNVPIPDGYIQPSGNLSITENGNYDVTEKASVSVNVEGGGGGESAEVVTKYAYTGTAVPNTGTISNVYWNTSLTMEEVNTLIQNANLTWADFQGMPAAVYPIYAVLVDGAPTSLVMIMNAEAMGLSGYVIMDMMSESIIFVSSAELGEMLGGASSGWDATLISNQGIVAVNGELQSSFAAMELSSIGAENDKLTSLISLTEFTKEVAETLPLSGTYDSNDLIITNNQNIDIKNSIETNKIIPLSIAIEVPDKLKDRLRGYLTDISPEYLEEVGTLSSYAFAGCDGLGTIVIPSTQIGNSIQTGTFMNSSVENVTIPEGITGIDNGAFSGCTSLVNINIPASVTHIGKFGEEERGAFEDSGIQSITFAQGSQLSEIYVRAFERCRLKEIELPENLTTIDNKAFYSSSIRNITIPPKVTVIPSNAFAYCRSLESVVIPKSVTFFSDNAFEGCDNIASVNYLGTIDEWASISFSIRGNPLNGGAQLKINGEVVTDVVLTATQIGQRAFDGCTSLTSVTMPSNAILGEGAFRGCTSLTSVTIPSYVASIPEYAFSGCTSLTSVTIPSNITQIGQRAFDGCTSLTSVTMPRAIKNIESSAFEGSVIKLFDFRNAQQIPMLDANGLGDTGLSSDCKIVVPDALFDYWTKVGYWSNYASYIVKASEYTE